MAMQRLQVTVHLDPEFADPPEPVVLEFYVAAGVSLPKEIGSRVVLGSFQTIVEKFMSQQLTADVAAACAKLERKKREEAKHADR